MSETPPPTLPYGVALALGPAQDVRHAEVSHRVTYNWTCPQEGDVSESAWGYVMCLESAGVANIVSSANFDGTEITVAYDDPDIGARVTAHFEATS